MNGLLEAPVRPAQGKFIIHAGGRTVEREEVGAVLTPDRTRSHVPIPHLELVESVETALKVANIRVIGEHHALSKDDNRYFGMLKVERPDIPSAEVGGTTYNWVVGIRNSHDKSLASGIVAGTQIFVCDNLAFNGDIKLSRKHTAGIAQDLPGLVSRAVQRLDEKWGSFEKLVYAMQEYSVSDLAAHDIIIRAYDHGAIPNADIRKVLDEWRVPTFEEFKPRNLWSLFNAFTYVLNRGKAGTDTVADRTLHLHEVAKTVLALPG